MPHRLRSGRWVDARTWAYDFARDLPGASVCRFTLAAGVRDLVGPPLAGQRAFAVRTGGSAVLEASPRECKDGIDERQAFVLALSAPAGADSIPRLGRQFRWRLDVGRPASRARRRCGAT